MLKRLILLVSAGFCLIPPEAGASVICDGFTPDVEVVPSFGHITKDRTLRAVDLYSKDAWGDLMVDHIDGQATLKAENQYRVQKAKKGDEVCVILTHINVLYKFDAALKLTNDYPKESCAHDQIIAHEERHAAVAKDFLSQTTPMLKDYVTKALSKRAGISTYDYLTEKAEAALQQRVESALQEYARTLNREHKLAQRRMVDLPEERAKIFEACPDREVP